MASGFWQYLQDNDRAPKTFRKLNLETRLQWQTLMESNFECLRYCDAHWKVNQIWINYYPSWLRTARREKAKAEKTSGDSVIDVEANSDEDESNNEDNDNNDQGNGTVSGRKNKRGPPASDETNNSKRPRLKELGTPAPRPRPVPKPITTNRIRVSNYFPPLHTFY